MSRIKQVFKGNSQAIFNIKEIAKICKIHRNTARRYLEILTLKGFLYETQKGTNRIFRLKTRDLRRDSI
ncbi:MAG: hypothetical protein GF329_01405 [Candidatus Lokiarchaeota archaeon]|nr:hypothetical protein [Candidatus Lokiarchaeota archaeon]